MAGKTYTHGLPEHVSAVKRNGKVTGYKYQRRIPEPIQPFFPETKAGNARTNLYLGKDLLTAIIKAHDLSKKHDEMIEHLSNADKRAEIFERGLSVIVGEKLKAADVAGITKSPTWRDTEGQLQLTSTMPPEMATQALAVFAAVAFDDRSYVDDMPLQPAFEALLNVPPAPPPSGGLETTMWGASKTAVDTRLAELRVQRKAAAHETITGRMDEYLSFKKVSDSTARNYRLRVRRLVDFIGYEIALDAVDPVILRGYRDHLMEGDDNNKMLSRSSVNQYFGPLITLFKWAYREDYISVNPTDKVTLPGSDKSVEETRWIAFDDSEIATVWRAVSKAWGPDGNHQLPKERRSAFLMAFRVLLWTGLRPNEIFKLSPDRVEPDRIRVAKTKTGAARTIPLAKAITEFHDVIRTDEWQAVASLYNPANKMSDSFRKIIRGAGLTSNRHVLYSCKDTMLDRLEALGASENIQRTIIGHVTGRGKLRNYKTSAQIEQMREYLDQIAYCDGLPA